MRSIISAGPTRRSLLREYSIAIAASLSAAAITFSAGPLLTPIRFFFFWCAVLIAALFGGTGSALLAILLCAISAAYLTLPPLGSFQVAGWPEILRLFMFVGFSGAISYAVGLRRREEQRGLLLRDWLLTTLGSIGDGVISTDRDGRVVFMNAAAQELTGWSAVQADGKLLEEVFQIIQEETRQPLPQPVDRTIGRGAIGTPSTHLLLLSRDGREIPIEDSAAPVREPDGRLRGAVIVFHDVTARRRSEDALLESERYFRAMADSAPVLLWMIDQHGEATFFNRRWLEFTGRPMALEIGRGWFEGVHPDDRVRLSRTFERALQVHASFTLEFRFRRADGEWRWVVSQGVPRLSDDSRFEGYIGSCIDIDDRKRVELGLRLLAEAGETLTETLDYDRILERLTRLVVPEMADWSAVAIPDADHGYRQVAVAHIDRTKVNLAWLLQERFPPNLANDPVLRTLQSGQPHLVHEVTDELLRSATNDEEHYRLIKELGFVSVMIVPLRYRDNIFGVMTLVSAESVHHYTEFDLAQAMEIARRASVAIENARLYREAQEANRTKDEFLATVSHELRTPLTAILGWSRLLLTTEDEQVRRTGLDTIHRSARMQNELIDDILDVSRFITGKLSLEIEPTELLPLLRDVIDAIAPTAQARQIELKTELPPASLVLLGDPKRLRQILWNLLSNAVKFTSAGGTVHLSAALEGTEIVLRVRDTGRGIDPKFLPRIWERFTQADSSTTREHGGLGLGLSVARSLVELHGGRITAESAGIGKGATFTVALPAGVLHSVPAGRDLAPEIDPEAGRA